MNEALRKAQEVNRKRKELGIKLEVKDPITKANEDPTSLRKAINGKCWDCIGRGCDPNPRQAIRDCVITDCTLFPVRPFQGVK